ncbi:T9SS type A sorting domain-containing protein [Hymenobacter sp. BT186]|uniref:T9SS type A sorting domain-containing protein n=1 Tax=Hymenobacter telluris TaxID=2816474 RepID=A0A939EWR9_9BACT|nr:T9SS type A sorting domain-containing protein [Hymenobacter telluris]MBO0358461.1 T9SS type A sorting domain-containing protein [Hymenobacter telluris]MBW3374487.1 T9SS type A sorting domain-containing protein [Hymenobacter norwichensis]
MNQLVLSLLFAAACLLGNAYYATAQTQTPLVQWDRTFGGTAADELYATVLTSDGGYIVGGASRSGISGDKTQPSQGDYDYWIVKMSATGVKQWERSFGGTDQDILFTLQQTSDGGYILGGISYSGIGGDKTQANQGIMYDYWVVKVDASGTKQWDRTYGGTAADELRTLQQTSDGGYILAGYTSSPDVIGSSFPFSVPADYWLIKVDANGTKQWDRTFGGSNSDYLSTLVQTSDGGYLLGGNSTSPISGDKTQPSQGSQGSPDYWVVKVDASGTKQWDRTFGGTNVESLSSLQPTSDGGYILGGYSYSPIGGDKTQPNPGYTSFWVVKVDASGTKQWDRTFGGTGRNELYALQQTSDGGYILGGQSDSSISGDKTQASLGGDDMWLVKVDANGTKQWDKTIGGSGGDYILRIQLTTDGGYFLAGSSTSGISGDKTQLNYGGKDYWVVKLGAAPLATTAATTRPALSAYPNPTRTQLTLRGPLGTPYQLLNQLGQVMLSGKLTNQPLDVHSLPAGLYLLRDQTTGRTTKLVKE